jgi:hypothetical protein
MNMSKEDEMARASKNIRGEEECIHSFTGKTEGKRTLGTHRCRWG